LFGGSGDTLNVGSAFIINLADIFNNIGDFAPIDNIYRPLDLKSLYNPISKAKEMAGQPSLCLEYQIEFLTFYQIRHPEGIAGNYTGGIKFHSAKIGGFIVGVTTVHDPDQRRKTVPVFPGFGNGF
jgi:hypothetical protein